MTHPAVTKPVYEPVSKEDRLPNSPPSDTGTTSTPHDVLVAKLVDRFRSMTFEEARRQISILPYDHNIENKITKPSQGVWTSRFDQEQAMKEAA